MSATARRAAFYSFVEQFSEEFSRTEQRRACAAYLAELLRPGTKPLNRVQFQHSSDALRHFVGRSSWSHEDVLRRLRTLLKSTVFDGSGVLLFRELQIPRRGFDAVGCDWQELLPTKSTRPRQIHGNCQTFIVAYWVDKVAAWPIDVCLYLPFKCTLRHRHLTQAGVPEFARSYRSKAKVALSMMEKLSREMGFSIPVLLEDCLTEDWNTLNPALARNMPVIGALHPQHAWPFWSPLPSTKNQRADWWVNDAIHNIQSNLHCMTRLARAKRTKPSAVYEVLTPTTLKRAAARSRDVSVLLDMNPKSSPKIYLRTSEASRRDAGGTITGLFLCAQARGEHLSEMGGIRRHEGRSWMGIHRHLTMCFLAECYRLQTQKM